MTQATRSNWQAVTEVMDADLAAIRNMMAPTRFVTMSRHPEGDWFVELVDDTAATCKVISTWTGTRLEMENIAAYQASLRGLPLQLPNDPDGRRADHLLQLVAEQEAAYDAAAHLG